ncbi:DUF4834 family protein [Bacteroides fluxus]|jgi:hypothetical protein|uniref:DUF4834 family protein n=1 Tax=Bacteroides fluxus TaxID=626930 RepID=UPI0023557EAC|nr:DUF4834 family protein [Bacteroides fluxus]
MFHLLGFLFILIIAILIIGLGIIGTVVRSIFGLGRRRTSSASYQNPGGYSYNNPQQPSGSSTQTDKATEPEEGEIHLKRKKLFSKDEGEYVEFEEIKE